MSNVGHGHVNPRDDGLKARCGGPSICPYCAGELSEKVSASAQVLSRETMDAIQNEAVRAHLKHQEFSMLSPRYSAGDRLAILVEEVGEVAHELTYDGGGPGVGEGRIEELKKELIQVSAMSASWYEYLRGLTS